MRTPPVFFERPRGVARFLRDVVFREALRFFATATLLR
jgi:hypothetical protein